MAITVIDTIEPKTPTLKVVDAKNVSYNGGELTAALTAKSSFSQFSYCSGNPVSITKHLNVFSVDESLSSSIYWPWLIKVDGLIQNPLGKYYLYYSTDHGQTAGYVSLAYSDHVLGPYTDYGRIYKYGNTETETPSVMWDETNNVFIMYIHCSGAYVGEAQTTYHVTSADGITWSTTPTKTLDLDSTKLHGNLHNGYFHPFRIGNQWVGYSLMGGNNAGHAISYSDDGYSWVTDHNQLGYWCLKDGLYLPPHHGTIISKWGQLWWIGLRQNFASGVEEKTGTVVIVPMQDLYTPVGQPMELFKLEDATYEGSDIREVSVYQEAGAMYIWYQCGNYFNVAFMSDGDATADSGGDVDPTPDTPDPVPTYVSIISSTSTNATDGLGTMRTWAANPIKPGKYKFKVTIDPAIVSAADNTSTVVNFKLASSDTDTNGTDIIKLQRSDCIDITKYEVDVTVTETRPYVYLYIRPFAIGSKVEIFYKDYDSLAPEPTEYELKTSFTTEGVNGMTKTWLQGPFSPGVYGIKLETDSAITSESAQYDSTMLTLKQASSESDNASESMVSRSGFMLSGLTTIEETVTVLENTPYIYMYFRPYAVGMSVNVYMRQVSNVPTVQSPTLVDTVTDTSTDTLGTIRKYITNTLTPGVQYKLTCVLSAAIGNKTQAADDNVKIFDFKYASSSSDNAGTSIIARTKAQLNGATVVVETFVAAETSHLYLYFRPYTINTNIKIYCEEV